MGLNDSLEAGRSLTLGTTFKTENIENIEKYFEATLATNLRDKKENDIPTKSSLNEKIQIFLAQLKVSYRIIFQLDIILKLITT